MSATPIGEKTQRRFKQYSKYKDSGIEWLGEIPAHWEVNRTKFAARLRSGHTPSRQHPEYWQDCTIPWFSLADVWQIRDGQTEYVSETTEKISQLGLANSAARLLPKGTVMLSRTASVGFSAIMGADMATTQDFVNWVCGQRLRPEFLPYVFRSMQHEFHRLTMGSTHQTVYMPDVGRLSTPIPPVPEQNQIVDFIRKETARIDALVGKKERLIELLQEKRTALNTRAVTKGLDPNVPMKNSGVEWLGEIPAHWVTLAFGRLVNRIQQGWSRVAEDRGAAADESVVIKLSAVNKGGGVLPNEHKALPPDLPPDKRYEIREGDFLLTRANTPELVGDVCVASGVRPGLMLCDLVYRIKLKGEYVAPSCLVYWLLSRAGRYQIEVEARGSSQSMVKVSEGLIRAWAAVLPPLEEQRGIAVFLDRQTARIDVLVAKVREAIDCLKELRTALISAAVTGRIDVREEPA